MHASTKFGETDGFNRLHDIPNALVVDGAEKNPAPTLRALAARGSDRPARHLRAI